MTIGGVARFWREIPQRYNLIGKQCGSCGRIYFPPRESCPYCRRKSIGKMRDIKLSGKGEIVTYTVIHVAPHNFEGQVPYPIAIVQLEEGPRITAQIVDCKIEDVKIGMKVEYTFRRIQEDGYTGAIYYGYKFKPCQQKQNHQ
ncbi:MAG: transcriptional regulator [Thermoplasmata archaeon]|nr:MAG: transcriptional regulator [Thermoplasmata archaeon]RLF36837.1 MAG: transcriptional regulator [Thermoplasmata archaeon]